MFKENFVFACCVCVCVSVRVRSLFSLVTISSHFYSILRCSEGIQFHKINSSGSKTRMLDVPPLVSPNCNKVFEPSCRAFWL